MAEVKNEVAVASAVAKEIPTPADSEKEPGQGKWDPEILAMNKIVRLLDGFEDVRAKARIVAWIANRYQEVHGMAKYDDDRR